MKRTVSVKTRAGDNSVPALALGLAAVIPAFVLCLIATGALGATDAPLRERLSFNAGWRFVKGDPAGSEGKLDYQALKPWLLASGADLGVSAPSPARPAG